MYLWNEKTRCIKVYDGVYCNRHPMDESKREKRIELFEKLWLVCLQGWFYVQCSWLQQLDIMLGQRSKDESDCDE